MHRLLRGAAALAVLCGVLPWPAHAEQTGAPTDWTASDLRALRSLWIETLAQVPPDSSNRVADDSRAADLGRRVFFDTRFSINGKVACATCHQPERYFTDGLAVSTGIGQTPRGAPSLLGAAYSPWFYWDGRRDSQWAQALVPFETPIEMGFDRLRVLQLIAEDDDYRVIYEGLFGRLPENGADENAVAMAFAQVGKALAAFERTLLPQASRFDKYVATLLAQKSVEPADPSALTTEEIAGLKIFISEEAQCTRCHNGPLFTNFGFHNIGLIELKRGVRKYDFGRSQGAPQALDDPFNCLGPYSDAEPEQCRELDFIKTRGRELPGAFKVPTLRNVAETAPYMHDGRFATLEEVLDHYRTAPKRRLGHQELNPLALTPEQIGQLVAFLKTLTGPVTK
ncbi:MAG: cytochrome-c peroxidase [Gammaproteobacteria bacterium]